MKAREPVGVGHLLPLGQLRNAGSLCCSSSPKVLGNQSPFSFQRLSLLVVCQGYFAVAIIKGKELGGMGQLHLGGTGSLVLNFDQYPSIS